MRIPARLEVHVSEESLRFPTDRNVHGRFNFAQTTNDRISDKTIPQKCQLSSLPFRGYETHNQDFDRLKTNALGHLL